KSTTVHGSDPSEAVTGEANYRVRQTLDDALGLISQLPHHQMVAANEVEDELAAECCDERLRLAKPFAEDPCPAVGSARFGSGVTCDCDQRRADCDLECKLAPVAVGRFR